MAQNGKPVGLLDSVEVFSETMAERFCDNKNSMLIIASDGNTSAYLSFGDDINLADSLSTALYNNDELFSIVQYSLALALCERAKRQRDNDAD